MNYVIRMSKVTHKKLKRDAKTYRRSMNSHALWAIDKWFDLFESGLPQKTRKPRNASEKFVLRLPDKMHRKIKRTAKKENVSMNTLIVSVLNWYL